MRNLFCCFVVICSILASMLGGLPGGLGAYATESEQNVTLMGNISPEVRNLSAQLKVEGNKVVNAETGEAVRLAGVNVPSLEWKATGEHVYTSVTEACDNWNANVIRLPLSSARWNGLTKEQAGIGAEPYRKMVADVVAAVQERGKYVILDCHWSDAGQTEELKKPENANTDLVNNTTAQHKMPDEGVKEMWLDMAQLYGNNPAVLFNIYNEPHSVSWEIWRNGGQVTDTAAGKTVTYDAVGHQEIVEVIRDAGAKNIIVAGGLDYAYALTGIVGKSGSDPKVYALVDQGSGGDTSKTGYGIIYDSHIYPWKNNQDSWERSVGCALDQYPVIIGESGWEKQSNETHDISMQQHLKTNSPYWVNELLDWIDNPTNSEGEKTGNPLHWTVWTFHPDAQPTTFSNWYYEPTPFWGQHVKDRLLSYPGTQADTKNYINQFQADTDWMARYVDQNGKTPGAGSIQSQTYEGDAAKITYSGSSAEIRMEPLPQISFKGMQSLHITLQPSASGTAEVGIAETDGELWTKHVELMAGEKTEISIPIHELQLTPFEGANGIFTGVAASVYIKPPAPGGDIWISNLVINRGGEEMSGYTAPSGKHGQTLEYVYWQDVILGGELQAVPFDETPAGTDLLHFLSQGTGGVTIQLTAGESQYQASVALPGGEEWLHCRLRPEDFGGLSDFSGITGIQVSGPSGAVLRHITFTNIEPPEYQPNPENQVDYCVDFEAGGDELYKLEYNAAALDVQEVEDDGNTVLQFAVKSGGDLMLRVNPDGEQSHVNLRDAQTLSFDIKGDGNYANINMGIMGTKLTTRIPIILEDDNWHRITLNLVKTGVFIPQFISGIKFYMSSFTGGTYQIDNISFTSGDTVVPDEEVIESFDRETDLYDWSGDVQTGAGYTGAGCTLAINQQPVTAALRRDSLAFWQRDLSGLRYVSFLAKTDRPGQPINLVLRDSSGAVMQEYQFSMTTTDWQTVSIPLLNEETALLTDDLASLSWNSDETCVLQIDDLCLNKQKPILPPAISAADVPSDGILLLHDDFEGKIEVVRSQTSLEVKEDGVPGWKASGTADAVSNMGLFQFSDYFNTSSFLSTVTDEEIYTLQYKSGHATMLYRDFERPDNDGITTVEMRVKYAPYGGNTIALYEKSGSDLTDNLMVAKIVLDENGGLTYQDEFMSSANKLNTPCATSVAAGDWVYIRAVVNSNAKTVDLYAGHSFEHMQPWTAERHTFNFTANNSKAPYVQAGSGLSSVAVAGRGVAALDDVRVYHTLRLMPPEASVVTVQGIPRAGEILTASYSYYDSQGAPEQGSVGKWESASDREFTADVKTVSPESCVSAETGSSYQVTDADTGRYLRFSITPKKNTDEAGVTVSTTTAKVGAADVTGAVFTKNGHDTSLDGIGITGTAGTRIFATNTTNEDKQLYVCVAYYGEESGILQSFYIETVTVPSDTAMPAACDAVAFPVAEDGVYKLYVWDEDQAPCCAPVCAGRSVTDLKMIVQEDFDSADGTDLAAQQADEENGWASGWKVTKSNAIQDIPADTYIIKDGSMTTVNPVYGGAGGYGFSIFRYLTDNSQIHLDADGEYFIRYTIPQVQYMVSASHNYQTQTLAFYTENKSQFSVGIKRKDDASNYMIFNTNFSGAPLEYKIEDKQKYTFVIWISARASGEDVCRIKLFKGDEAPTWFPLSWDYEAAASKSNVINALALSLNNHSATQIHPSFDDIQVLKHAAIYVERNNYTGLLPGETLRISIPEENVYGNPQILDRVEWFLVSGGEHQIAGTGTAFTVPAKYSTDMIRARVTMTDQVTGKTTSFWALSDHII